MFNQIRIRAFLVLAGTALAAALSFAGPVARDGGPLPMCPPDKCTSGGKGPGCKCTIEQLR